MSGDYYTVPEDVRMSWASLIEDLTNASMAHGGETMTFTLIVREGIPSETVQPVYHQREPRGVQSPPARLWWAVIRRLQSVGCGLDRDSVVEIRIDLDLGGNPTTWLKPDVRFIEPRNK